VEDFNSNDFSDSLTKAWSYAKNYSYICCCEGCKKEAIKSHLLQQHPVLKSICDKNNNLLQFVDNIKDPRSRDWNFYQKHLVGISNALQFKLFCKKHDTELFKTLEQNQNSIPKSKRDCLLLAYRSACAVRHQEECRLHIYESLLNNKSVGLLIEQMNVSKAFIMRMNAVVNGLWDALNGNGDNYYLFRMISMPKIELAVSDCIISEKDFEEHIMDEDYCEPLNYMSINIIPSKNDLLLLLGCDTRYDKENKYKEIITSFPTGDLSYNDFEDTLKGILLKCNNWCCSPELNNENKWKEFFDEYESMKVQSILAI
jgi:hypothetical protein